jgi:hypothetical protein
MRAYSKSTGGPTDRWLERLYEKDLDHMVEKRLGQKSAIVRSGSGFVDEKPGKKPARSVPVFQPPNHLDDVVRAEITMGTTRAPLRMLRKRILDLEAADKLWDLVCSYRKDDDVQRSPGDVVDRWIQEGKIHFVYRQDAIITLRQIRQRRAGNPAEEVDISIALEIFLAALRGEYECELDPHKRTEEWQILCDEEFALYSDFDPGY